jgi:hypothetical protein
VKEGTLVQKLRGLAAKYFTLSGLSPFEMVLVTHDVVTPR